MLAFLSWYLIISVVGWLSLPVVFRLFGALPDRGYTAARAAGLLLWGYAFWLMATLGFVRNDLAGALLAALAVLGLSVWALTGHRAEFSGWLRGSLRLMIASELVFLAAFAAMAVVRAANPGIYGTEKPMELAFIDSILRSPVFPPRDPWLSGYAISYYYFGYILTALLARVSAVPGTAAFNLMLALVFGMAAMGAYGILYNLLAIHRRNRAPAPDARSLATGLPLLAPLFLLIVSNAEGFLEVLHRLGAFWTFHADGTASSSFWRWLDIKDLVQQPALPLGLQSEGFRYLWWWRASRVVQDYDLAGNFQEVIDEFPAFSFVLGDLHPHVLALPFGLLAVAFALNLYLGGVQGSIDLFGARLRMSPSGFLFAAFLLGGLAFLNIWDILMAAALVGGAYVLLRVREDGWDWGRVEDLLLLGVPLVAVGLLLYLPFFVGFSSQAGGILPNLVNPTRGAHLWVMFGTLLVPVLALLVYLLRRPPMDGKKASVVIALGLPLALWVFSWLLAWLVSLVRPDFAAQFLSSQGAGGFGSFFAAATARRLASIGGLLTLVAVLYLSVRPLSALRPNHPEEAEDAAKGSTSGASEPLPFIAFLILMGALLVLAPEFVYLRDQFGTRMNTIFKFYYQAWMLWSLAASFGIAFLLERLEGLADWFFRAVLIVVLVISLTYPVLAFASVTNDLKPAFGFTLDDFNRIQRENPDEAGAIAYLKSAPDGIVAEAVGGSYTAFARISTYTGLPTVLGWPGHEVQWRGTADPQGTRQEDIATLYSTSNWQTARDILEKYDIRYVVVGGLERQAYAVQEDKFRNNLMPVYQTGTISIYQVP